MQDSQLEEGERRESLLKIANHAANNLALQMQE